MTTATLTNLTTGALLTVGDGTSGFGLAELDGVWSLPDVRSSAADLVGRHGAVASGSLSGARVVTLDVTAAPTETETLQALIAAMGRTLTVGVWVRLDLALAEWGGEPRSTVALVRKRDAAALTPALRATGIARYRLELYCPDPRWYATPVASVVPGGAVVVAGRTYPKTYPYTYGAGTSPALVTVTNDGDISTPWSIAIPGPCANPTVVDTGTGQRLEIAGTVPEGSTLLLDTATRTVSLDGQPRYQWLTPGSVWWELPPGDSELRFTATSTHVGATISAASAWL